MKKLIALIGVCMLAYITPASAETTGETETGKNAAKCEGKRPSPEQIAAKIDERIKKLDEHKAKATSAGKTDIVNAIQGLEDALKNLKNAKDKEAFKAAHEKVKAAREALKNAIPEKVKEKIKEQRAGKKAGNTGDASQNL
ncbi:MAG TPA: hypothetical protein DCZ94_07145 [Lentisphaeria bacterium]|nr:MAG: hypothetical protein A2X48_10240 [Lentisphaerae bacterium GWF2_49_21]HBC86711.1 hypothetical protein [Lentisphaeria bacterium]